MRIEPPYLQLGFYFHDFPHHKALARVAKACIELGAEPTGTILFRRPENISKPLQGVYMESLFSREYEPSNIVGILETSNDYPVSITIKNAVGTVKDAEEEIAFSYVSEEAAQRGQNPVTLYSDGSMLFLAEYMDKKGQKIADQAWQKTKDAFEKIAFKSNPTYGAITMEWNLGTPYDILQKDQVMFFTFYLSHRDFTYTQLEIVKQLYFGARIVDTQVGMLVTLDKEKPWGEDTWAWTYEEKLAKTNQLLEIIANYFK